MSRSNEGRLRAAGCTSVIKLASIFNATVTRGCVRLADIKSMRIQIAESGGMIVAEVERFKLDGVAVVVDEQHQAVTFIERYAISSLFAEAWLLEEACQTTREA